MPNQTNEARPVSRLDQAKAVIEFAKANGFPNANMYLWSEEGERPARVRLVPFGGQGAAGGHRGSDAPWTVGSPARDDRGNVP